MNKKTSCGCEACKAVDLIVSKLTKVSRKQEEKPGQLKMSDVYKIPVRFEINTKTKKIKVKSFKIKVVPRVIIGLLEEGF